MKVCICSAALAVVALFFVLPAAAVAAPGHPACTKLEQACLTTQARARQAQASDANSTPDVSKASDDICYDRYAQAKSTGVFPAFRSAPPILCSNN